MKKQTFDNLPKDWAKEVKYFAKRNKRLSLMIGVDFGYRYNWFDRLLIWLHLKKSEDFSCMVLGSKKKNGSIEILKIKYLK